VAAFGIKAVYEQKVGKFHFIIQAKNVGYTPTKNMTTHHSWLPSGVPLPDDYRFEDIWSAGELHVPTPLFAAPQIVFETKSDDISENDVRAVSDHKEMLYFWGWAKYNDVFKDTPVHLTEYCVIVSGFRGDPFVAGTEMVLNNCPSHNCQDQECTDYKERTRK